MNSYLSVDELSAELHKTLNFITLEDKQKLLEIFDNIKEIINEDADDKFYEDVNNELSTELKEAFTELLTHNLSSEDRQIIEKRLIDIESLYCVEIKVTDTDDTKSVYLELEDDYFHSILICKNRIDGYHVEYEKIQIKFETGEIYSISKNYISTDDFNHLSMDKKILIETILRTGRSFIW